MINRLVMPSAVCFIQAAVGNQCCLTSTEQKFLIDYIFSTALELVPARDYKQEILHERKTHGQKWSTD